MVRSSMTTEEKAEIWRRYRGGASLRSIHQALGRSGKTVWDFVASTGGIPPVERARSTVSREVAGHGGRACYRACIADRAAWEHARRPKPAKLATHRELGALVATKLKLRWSPQQIAGWLR